ncbi:uncharacterized protein LOC135841188 [Planococcus citri]|uniref:uncharacterized protein LOC135841188 n=1 Tax=Planococcus citri TaxID=170843 RepID=UPI0031F94C09
MNNFSEKLMKLYAIIQILFVINVNFANGYNSCYDQPEKVLKENCKVLDTGLSNPSDYKAFFPIPKTDSGEIALEFFVKGDQDVSILISPTEELPKTKEEDLHAYEIVLDSGKTHSSIRRHRLHKDVAVHRQGNVLSPKEWRQFKINISTDGIIRVGNSSNEAFLFWKDQDVLPIDYSYYSFSSHFPHRTSWYHECKNEAGKIYNQEKLKYNFFGKGGYHKEFRPNHIDKASPQIEIQSSYLDLNILNGFMELRGTIIIEWFDERLTWYPYQHDGQDSFEIDLNPIWRPEIQLTNQVFVREYFIGVGKTIIFRNGWIKHTASSNIQSRCQIGSNSKILDIYTCNLNFNMDIHANFTFSKLTYSGVTSPWVITETQCTYSLVNDETKRLETASIDLKLKRNISQPSSSSVFAKVGFVVLLLLVGAFSLITVYLLVQLAKNSRPPSKDVQLSTLSSGDTNDNEGENSSATGLLQPATNEENAGKSQTSNNLQIAIVIQLSTCAICLFVLIIYF